MRKIVLLAAVLLWGAPSLPAQTVSGQAVVGYQQYDYDSLVSSGIRQSYIVRLNQPLSEAVRFFMTLRGEDFGGREDNGRARVRSNTRILQPTANLSIDLGAVRLLAKSDYIDSQTDLGGAEANRSTQRTMGEFTWQPTGLPSFSVIGQRNASREDVTSTSLTDDYLIASTQYDYRGLQLNVSEQYSSSDAPTLGYTRSNRTHSGDLQYTGSYLAGRMMVAAQAGARLTHVDQRATKDAPASVPNPIAIVRAYWGIDDTPSDDRDHPLVPIIALIDGDLNRSAGISLGPDGSSFHNFAIDAGRIERVDEVRIVVRDRAGDPLRKGGGVISWDAYSSTDGVMWTPIASASSSFDSPLSNYSVTFDPVMTRWIKVVSFGLNSDETFVTEIQGFHHTTIAPGATRDTDQNFYTSTLTSTYQPTKRLTLSYSGIYNVLRQRELSKQDLESTDIAHLGYVQYELARAWTVRGQYRTTDAEAIAGQRNTTDGYTSFLEYAPTQKLRLSLEYGSEQQMLGSSRFSIDTRAFHAITYILPSLSATLDAGLQDQTFEDGLDSHRQYAVLIMNAQLTRTLRSRLAGSFQRTDATSTDPGVSLLGPSRDNRASLDLIWSPGEKLTLTGRFGYAQGFGSSGFTHRYHAEWMPFGDGTVTLAASYDQDIDPASGRRASRILFNPRWAMNRRAAFDLNYTVVSTTSEAEKRQQRTAFATLTITK